MLLLLAAIYNAIIPKAIILKMWLNRLSGVVLQALEDSAPPGHVAQKSKVFCVVLLAPQSNKWTAEDGVHRFFLKSEPRFAVMYKYSNYRPNSNKNVFYYIKAVPSKKISEWWYARDWEGENRAREWHEVTQKDSSGAAGRTGSPALSGVLAGPLASQGVKNHPHLKLYQYEDYRGPNPSFPSFKQKFWSYALLFCSTEWRQSAPSPKSKPSFRDKPDFSLRFGTVLYPHQGNVGGWTLRCSDLLWPGGGRQRRGTKAVIIPTNKCSHLTGWSELCSFPYQSSLCSLPGCLPFLKLNFP